MDDTSAFEQQRSRKAAALAASPEAQRLLTQTLTELDKFDYTYQSTWMGLPIIQSPSDIVVQQEIIWGCRPTVIIETGVARGGSVVFLASMLSLVNGRKVIGVDIDIRAHNRARIEAHPMAKMIELIEGSSTAPDTIGAVKRELREDDRVMVVLDSNHTHTHVLEELRLFAPLVTPGQFLVVADTVVEYLPVQDHRPRPWGPGNNPMTAMREFQLYHPEFITDRSINDKLALSCNPEGYLRREPIA